MKTKKVVINARDAEEGFWFKSRHGEVIKVIDFAYKSMSGDYYMLAEENLLIPVRYAFDIGAYDRYCIPAVLYEVDKTPSKFMEVATNLAQLLEHKNQKYGDSALNPIKVFSKLDSSNSLYVRLDDKISRIKNSDVLRKNDIADLMGYLILVCLDNNWTDFSEFKD